MRARFYHFVRFRQGFFRQNRRCLSTPAALFFPFWSLVLEPKASSVLSDPPSCGKDLTSRTFEIFIVSPFFCFVKGFREPITDLVIWLPPLVHTVGRLVSDFQSGERRLYPLLTYLKIEMTLFLSVFSDLPVSARPFSSFVLDVSSATSRDYTLTPLFVKGIGGNQFL